MKAIEIPTENALITENEALDTDRPFLTSPKNIVEEKIDKSNTKISYLRAKSIRLKEIEAKQNDVFKSKKKKVNEVIIEGYSLCCIPETSKVRIFLGKVAENT